MFVKGTLEKIHYLYNEYDRRTNKLVYADNTEYEDSYFSGNSIFLMTMMFLATFMLLVTVIVIRNREL